MSRPDHREAVALRKIGNPKGWSVFQWEALTDGSVLFRMGAELERDEQGMRQWGDGEKTANVSPKEYEEEFLRYETETGKCGVCGGGGKEWIGWNHETGNKFETCRRCSGTGTAVRS